MKKRFLVIMFAFVIIFCGAFMLTACGEDDLSDKIVFKLTNNAINCNCDVAGEDGGAGETANGITYINKNTNLVVYIYPKDNGYYTNDIKVFVNGVERPFLDGERSLVAINRYERINLLIENPINNIDIKITGSYVLASGNAKFAVDSSTNISEETNTYIRFEQSSATKYELPTEEMTLADFYKNYIQSEAKIMNTEYGKGFTFYIYRKNYDIVPNSISIDTGIKVPNADISLYDGNIVQYVYIDEENNNYGYKYVYSHQYSPFEIIQIGETGKISAYISTVEDDSSGISLNATDVYKSADNKISFAFNPNTKVLAITLYDYNNIPQDVLEGLKLSVNTNKAMHNNFSFATGGENCEDNPNNKVFKINVEDSYKYNTSQSISNIYYSYSYNFYINFYDFPEYFTNTELNFVEQ